MFRVRALTLRLFTSLTLSALLVGPALGAHPTAAAPNALKDHFAVGISASPDANGTGWMVDSKIPWDYAYQYLAGGVNTGHGWPTWNDKGQFPLFYATGAASHGYTPVFSYYELLQSDGPCASCGESDKDLAHLKDASIMKAYYADFALLMKRLGPGNYDGVQGFGQPAIVHVEPDLSGYVQHTAGSTDPASVPAAVASTGMPDVAAFPDTYQGFNWALLHLRDQYAPNVQLAFHVSTWATGQDISTSKDAGLNAQTIGGAVGAFAAASGVTQAGPNTSNYDLLFSDVGDRDAGFYAYTQKDPSHWWDRLNQTLPNFTRWEQWIAGVVNAAGNKPMFIWQIPIGNQYFQTLNNTNGHYQDNRVEYFFAHIGELRQVGIVGLLFGGGAGGVTTYNDQVKDGVTNGDVICTSDGISSGQICNDHPSTVSDDDGGYLRMVAQQYYASPVALGDVAARPAAPQTGPATAAAAPSLQIDLGSSSIDPKAVTAGQQVMLRQNTISNADATVLVDFELWDADGNRVLQSVVPNQKVLVGLVGTTTNALTIPSDLPAGSYALTVSVFSNDGRTLLASTDSAGAISVAAAPPDANE